MLAINVLSDKKRYEWLGQCLVTKPAVYIRSSIQGPSVSLSPEYTNGRIAQNIVHLRTSPVLSYVNKHRIEDTM